MSETGNCIHCGENCGTNPVTAGDKLFCCEGCKLVYSLLNDNKLGRYYEISKMPGVKINDENIPRNERYNFLDLPEIRSKLIDFSNNDISRVRLFIPAIHCASCIWLLENLHTLHSGIIQSSVNFPQKELTVTFSESKISLRKVVELLHNIHYIPEINAKSADKKNASEANRTLLIKIGIAGFSFMNAMIYHFPQYLPGNRYLDPGFKTFFGILSFILSIPVLFYCAGDYFKTAWKSLKNKAISIDLPIVLGLLAFFLQSIYEIISGSGIGYIDSLTGLVFFMLVGKWYQGITYQALSFERDYKTYFPVAVTVVENGLNKTVPIEKLKQGDVILVRNQEIIPADSVMVNGSANIDYSFVTGESLPVAKTTGDFIFAGGRQVGSSISLRVEKEVEQSYLTQLWNQGDNKTPGSHYLKNTVNRVSRYFTVTILFIALLSAVYWYFHNPSRALFAFTSVLIIACPCALALTVPFTFGSTVRQFGRRGFYLKNADVIETFTKTTTIVFDKTGTITHSKLSVVKFNPAEALSMSEDELAQLVKSVTFQSTHPLSKILSGHYKDSGTVQVDEFRELTGLGIKARVGNNEILLGSKFFVTGMESQANKETSEVWLSVNRKITGYFSIENHYRDGLRELTETLKKRFDIHLISGDNDAEMEKLTRLLPEGTILNFNQSPTDKLNYIKKLQQQGKKVVMIGDGLNDAGALKESDAGIVIADDIYNFSPACDAILQSSNFTKLGKYINFTRTSMQVVRISFFMSFIYNTIGLSFAVQGNLSPILAAILMPLSSVSVVTFATLAISLLAFKLDEKIENI